MMYHHLTLYHVPIVTQLTKTTFYGPSDFTPHSLQCGHMVQIELADWLGICMLNLNVKLILRMVQSPEGSLISSSDFN